MIRQPLGEGPAHAARHHPGPCTSLKAEHRRRRRACTWCAACLRCRCEWITDRNVQDMLIAGGEWWLDQPPQPDNSFEYKYWPVQNRRSTEYNEVRHILGARDLADTYRYRNDPRYLEGLPGSDGLAACEALRSTPMTKPQGPLPHPPARHLLFRYPELPAAGAGQASKRTRSSVRWRWRCSAGLRGPTPPGPRPRTIGSVAWRTT